MTTAPKRRLCRSCGQLATPEDLVLLGRTESKAGWCGGPRQGGRPVFAHAACLERDERSRQEASERHDARLAAGRRYLDACKASGAAPEADRLAELLDL